ncbi:MAG: serine/threonine protein kinase [Pirellulales bacterium]|nr:serine/threonine protein kinase [Pirellulales bacterium]
MSATRYEIVGTVATGDFATVYRARDRELGREVAIKQIHQQFLGDPRQLERYWREAQLLASLQHPNILTIYDIVRPRGWLVLELMQGNLHRTAETGPIDLDYLRIVLSSCLGALHFLHTNGIIHGDVKPSNILVNPQNIVKLGDFGLARRASSEQGSLLKGTTKYMAPELVTNQFGPIGPASDLYSLGFSAYELLCGPQFESLFPGLATYGRDRQIAWLMWHAAPDRTLPEIHKVLQGVPPDLTHVIQRLVAKDQSRRYRSAQEVLHELHAPPAVLAPPKPDQETDPAAAKQARKKKRMRIVAVVAMTCSLLLSAAMLLPSRTPPPADAGGQQPAWGTIRTIYPDERSLVLESGEDGNPKEILFKPGDEFFVNDKKALLRDLQPGDRAQLEILRDQAGGKITILRATRPEAARGRIQAVDADAGALTVAVDQQEQPLVVRVPAAAKITFNGKDQLDGKPIALADLRPDDRVVVSHLGEETGRAATALEVQRVVRLEGVVRDLNASKGLLTVARGEGSAAQVVSLPLAPNCEVTINDLRFLDQKMLKPGDLKPGDRVTIAHDTQIVRVDAYRVLGQAGVVQSVDAAARTLQVQLENGQTSAAFVAGPAAKITLAGEPAELADLRPGDQIDVTHDSPDAKNPQVLSIAARRTADPNRWAIVVGVQDYEDQTLSPLKHTVADANLVEDMLVKRHRVPKDQALLLTDPSLVRLEQGIANLLARVEADDHVVLYFAGHAYKNDEGKTFLAPKNFDLKRISDTGMPLQKLVDQLEQCPAKEKLLLLDTSHAGTGEDLARQPSAAEMVQTLDAPPGRVPFRSVVAIAGTSPGQRGQVVPDRQHGLFALSLADAFSGRGDVNRDNRMEPTELYTFLTQTMASAGAAIQKPQTPKLFLPDASALRLTDEAKAAIRKLAAYLRQDRIDLGAAKTDYETARQLSGKEIESQLLYGLVLLKARERTEAIRHFEPLKLEHPALLLPAQAIVWLDFDRRSYPDGVAELAELMKRLPRPKKPAEPYPDDVREIFRWAGQLREFAADAAEEGRRASEPVLAQLDSTVAALGNEAAEQYNQGRSSARLVMEEFDKKITAAADAATLSKLRVDRRQIVHYASFPFDTAAQQILDGLDR